MKKLLLALVACGVLWSAPASAERADLFCKFTNVQGFVADKESVLLQVDGRWG